MDTIGGYDGGVGEECWRDRGGQMDKLGATPHGNPPQLVRTSSHVNTILTTIHDDLVE